MSVTIKGEKQLLDALEEKLGKKKMEKVSDKALQRGAEVFVRHLKDEFRKFSDGKGYSEGHSLDEITLSKPMTVAGVRSIKVHWRGPHDRYRIIHLNEFGTVKNPNPAGKGAIARAMRNAEKEYREAIKQAIQEGI